MMNGEYKSVAPSRRKEKHVSRACNSCRRKKSKCDGVQPICGTCIGTQIECTWTQEEDGRRPATKAQVDAMSMEIRTLKTDKERQQAEIERLRAEVARLSGDAASPDSASAPAHTRHSSLSIQIPRPPSAVGRPGHAHALSTDSFLHPPGSPSPAAYAHSPGSVTSSLPSPMPTSGHFLTVPNYGYRGASPDGSIYSSTDEDEPPRSAVSDSDGEASGILPSFTSTEKKLAISDDQDGLLAVGGASPLALTCSPPHTPARSRASSFRGSFSGPSRPTLAGFRFPPSAAPTPHNSLSSPTAETELEHSAQCPCDWQRFLPPGLGLAREEHDTALALYFTYGAGWGMRVVRHKFMRDMRAALSAPPDQPLPPTAHWSPALHCAVLADAAAYASQGSRLATPDARLALAAAARDYADSECTKESGVVAAVQALAVLARYHLGFPKGARLAYARFGMAVRVAVAAGLNMDCSDWVRLGRIDEEEQWDRDWCYFSLLVQDVDISLHVGQDLSVPPPPAALRPPQPAPDADGGVHDVFLVTVSLMRLAARMMAVLQAPGAPDASEVGAVQSALARWHADLPDALQWHRTSSTSALPHVIVLHMAHWWVTIMLHRPFYVGRGALDESVKFIDDAARKILRAIGTYERLYTLARVPLSVTQMAFAAGAAALLRADAAQPGAMKKRREALEACTAAVNALRSMGAAWPCAAGYADALESRMALVGRPRAVHSPSPSYASSSAHGHNLSLSVPSVVVHNNDDGGLAAQMGGMFNMFGGPGACHSPFIPGSPAAPMPMDFGGEGGGAGGLGLWPGDADPMLDMYTSPTASQDSAAPSGYATFQSSPTQQQDGFAFQAQASPTAFQSSPTQQQDGFVFTPQNPSPTQQQDGFVFQHAHAHSPSASQDYLQTHAHSGSQGGQQGFVGVNNGWPQGTSPSGWSQ
ncbi:hypothetical protein AURDEDRAFT_116080 [Auricularia subglabra TFB-10046 SS5]|nr:hypothetical protein AURDEDRAFT_116080 [Auricularia subglabra TFB-10046 SS5]